jgi:5-methylcytosine-specific restriction endonuclease McrA
MSPDPEKRREQHQRWTVANRDKANAFAQVQNAKPSTKARKAAWVALDRMRNPDKYAEIRRRYRERNSERIRALRLARKAKALTYNRAYREANRETINQKGREYRELNTTKERARSQAYHIRRPDVAYKNTLARRARRAGVAVERVDPIAVFERDGWKCGICLRPVVKEEASVDHIVPIARGGEHSYANVQLAHLSCNKRKGVKLLPKQEETNA